MRFDGRTFFASVIAIGFLILTGIGMFHEIPAENIKTIDGAMVAIGTALGAAVMALLRNSQADDVKAQNTGKALDTIGAAIAANPPGPLQAEVINNPDNPVPTENVT